MYLVVLALLTCAVPVAMLASLWQPIAPLGAPGHTYNAVSGASLDQLNRLPVFNSSNRIRISARRT